MRRIVLAISLSSALVAAGLTAPAAVASESDVHLFPEAGSVAASPGTSVSLRGVPAEQAGEITVVGDESGAHSGEVVAHSDGEGVSFVPDEPFAEGETVEVTTEVPVDGATTTEFTVAEQGAALPTRAETETAAAAAASAEAPDAQLAAQLAAAPVGVQQFVTRPDLRPAAVQINQDTGGAADGLVMLAVRGPEQNGPMIIDDAGQVVWFQQSAAPFVADLKVVDYLGQQALAWYEGAFTLRAGVGAGEYVMVDRSYRELARVRAGNGYEADLHELEITPDQTALVLVYTPVELDLRPYGGPADGVVLDQVVQEIDIPTGSVLFEWHSLDHIPLTATQQAPPTSSTDNWDYVHGNSIDVDTDGNYLLSGRSSSNVYKIDRTTGEVLWTLGVDGDFTPTNFPASDWFASQHDARRRADGTLGIFDNGAGPGLTLRSYSRGLVLAIDETAMTATAVQEFRSTPDRLAASQGSFAELAGGNELIGWGALPFVTEMDSAGTVVWEAQLPTAVQSYRAARQAWVGLPVQEPDLAVTPTGTGTFDVSASWNGATEVATWEVLAGSAAGRLNVLTSAPRTGFETIIPVSTDQPIVAVRARDGAGKLLGTSLPAVTGGFFGTTSASPIGSYTLAIGDFGGSREDDVFYYGADAARDFLALADGSGGVQPGVVQPAAGGQHTLLVGNFVGDDRDEIVFWSPQQSRAWMWRFDGASVQQTSFGVQRVDQAIVLDHNADRLGSIHDEILWASDAPGGDSVDHFRWPAGGSMSRTWILVNTQRRFQPIVGDFDGNGWADVFWYAPGATTDYLWFFDGEKNTGTTGYTWRREQIGGPFVPLVGDFGAADGAADILWYRSGGATDYLYQGSADRTWQTTPLTAGGTGTATVMDSASDYVVLNDPGTQLSVWDPAADVVLPTGNTAPAAAYRGYPGRFSGTTGSGIYWYAAWRSPELYVPWLP